MKYTRFFAVAVAAMASVGCVKENTPDNNTLDDSNLVEFTITAGVEDPMTKAAFGDEYPTIEWKDTDLISVLGAKTGNQQFKANSSGVSTEFNGLLDLEDETLYAVYPYNAAIQIPATPSSNNEELVEVTIPSVQYATEESFDPSAYVAVAKSTDKNFSFKSIGSFIKFQLEDGENVKSVTIVANNSADDKSTTIATTAAVRFNSDGTPTHGLTGWKNSTNTIRLVEKDGGDQFKSGKDYFIVLRAHTLPTGIQIYVEYDNGTVYTRSTTSQIFPSGKARNTIANMGTFGKSHKFTQVNDLYSLYNMGYDIEIAGKAYNKSTLTLTPSLISTAGQVISDNGLYFINPDAKDVSINRATGGYSNLFVIGNDPTQKTEISLGREIRCGTNSNICLKNVSISQYTGNMLVHNNNNAAITRIAFDACKIVLPSSSKSLIFNEDTRTINECAIHNCDIEVTGATQSLITARENYTTVDLYNNIFYSETNRETFKLFRADSPTEKPAEITNVKVANNTFVNVYPEKNTNNGYIYANKVTGSYALLNNLFELKDLITISGTYRNFLVCIDNTYPAEKTFINGYMHAVPETGKDGQCCIKAWGGNENPGTTYGKTDSSFVSQDFETPSFVKTATRTTNGATR